MADIALGTALAAIGAGVAIGFAGLGSGLGQGMAAAGSVGAVAEDNDMFARGIIFSALPETQAIYGFLLITCILRIIRWRKRLISRSWSCSYWCRCIYWFRWIRFRYGTRYCCILIRWCNRRRQRHVRTWYYFLCITRDSGYLRFLDCYFAHGIRWNLRLRRQFI